MCLTPAQFRVGSGCPELGSKEANTRATSLTLTRDALRFAKSEAIPSPSCSVEDGLSVVHVSFAKGLTGVEGGSRWLSATLQADVRAKTTT